MRSIFLFIFVNFGVFDFMNQYAFENFEVFSFLILCVGFILVLFFVNKEKIFMFLFSYIFRLGIKLTC
jgi:hypothetical protein